MQPFMDAVVDKGGGTHILYCRSYFARAIGQPIVTFEIQGYGPSVSFTIENGLSDKYIYDPFSK